MSAELVMYAAFGFAFVLFVRHQIAPMFLIRSRLGARASNLLAEMGDREETEVFVRFASNSEVKRRKEIDAVVREMTLQGWTFLRLKAAPVRMTAKSWGGGIMAVFVRPLEEQKRLSELGEPTGEGFAAASRPRVKVYRAGQTSDDG